MHYGMRSDEEESVEKVGHFEWIISYPDIKHYFLPPYLSPSDLGDSSAVLVIGCGTSMLAECIAQDFAQSHVIAVDNDPACIEHMIRMTSGRVMYECYDLVDPTPSSSSLHNCSFNLLVDKGTFDAVLVEGSVASLIEEITRVLRVGGKYMLVTINKQPLIRSLFGFPGLSFHISHTESLFGDHEANVFIFEKMHEKSCSTEELQKHEKIVLDNAFRVESSLLDENYERQLRYRYNCLLKNADDQGLDPITAYHLMFDERPDLGYSLEMFLDDAKMFFDKKYFKIDDVLEFIRQVE